MLSSFFKTQAVVIVLALTPTVLTAEDICGQFARDSQLILNQTQEIEQARSMNVYERAIIVIEVISDARTMSQTMCRHRPFFDDENQLLCGFFLQAREVVLQAQSFLLENNVQTELEQARIRNQLNRDAAVLAGSVCPTLRHLFED